MQKTKFILTILIVMCVTAIVIVALATANANSTQDRFSVTGSGVVYAKADVANISVGLKTEAKSTAAEATSENIKTMNEIVKELKNLGVEEKDIKTTNYRLSPVYNWTQNRGQELKGYEVNQTVTIKVRNLDKIGEIIAKTTEKGANQIGNVNFTIDDEYELKAQARELAITKAKEKAKEIAKQSGMRLGVVKSFYENEYQPIYLDYIKSSEMGVLGYGGESIESPSIEAGQNLSLIHISEPTRPY